MFLKILAQFDEQVDQQIKKVGGRMGLFGVATFLTLFATIFITAGTDGNLTVLGVGGALFAVFLIIFIGFWIKSSALKKINLDNSFRETLLPLLTILSEEIPPKAKIALELNLGDPTDKKFKISEKKLPPGRNRKLIETVFCFPACHAKIPLENGTQLVLDLVKNPASYDRHYRTARGKYKQKRKWKMVTQVTAGLVPVSDEFLVNEEDVDRMAESVKVKLKEKHGGQLCCLTKKIKSKSAMGVPEDPVAPDVVIEMFMKLCTMLNPAV